jgi:hypothetical protein
MREKVIEGRGRAVGMGEEVKCSRDKEELAMERDDTVVCAERVKEMEGEMKRFEKNEQVRRRGEREGERQSLL